MMDLYLNPWAAVKNARVPGAPGARAVGVAQSSTDKCLHSCCCLRIRRGAPKDSEQQPAAWSGMPQEPPSKSLYHLRRALAERFDVSHWLSAPKETEEDSMFCCVPLRSAVFLTALGHALLSWMLLLWRASVHEEFRVFIGGYSQWSRAILDVVDVAGAFFAVLGVFGTVYLRTSYVKVYQLYLLLHIPAAIVMYYTDVPLLYSCELWKTDSTRAIGKYGWSGSLYEVALADECPEERRAFFVRNAFSIFLFMYIVAGTQRFLESLEAEPEHLFRLPKDGPSGAFRVIGGGARGNDSKYGAVVGPPVGLMPFPQMGQPMPYGPPPGMPMGPPMMPMGPPMTPMGPPMMSPPMGY